VCAQHVIGKADRVASRQKIDVHVYMQRLRAHIHSSSDRNLIQAFHELDILKDKLVVSNAAVDCIHLRKAQTRGLVQ
jgi:hypothetical protein